MTGVSKHLQFRGLHNGVGWGLYVYYPDTQQIKIKIIFAPMEERKGMRHIKYNYGNRDKKFVMIKREWFDDYLFGHKIGLRYLRLLMHIGYHGRTDPHGRINVTLQERRRLAYTYGLTVDTFDRQVRKTIKLGMLVRVDKGRIKFNHRIFILVDGPPSSTGILEKKKNRAVVEPKGETGSEGISGEDS